MKQRLFFAVFFVLFFAAFLSAKEANWIGNYTDKKYLNGQAHQGSGSALRRFL
jgi:hypothetical protein